MSGRGAHMSASLSARGSSVARIAQRGARRSVP
jgi:hypothetical protein